MRLRAERLFAAALAGLVGCTQVSVTEEQTYRAISDNTHRDNYGPWQNEVSLDLQPDRFAFQAVAARKCDVHVDRVGDQTTTIRREDQHPGGTIILTLVGIAGASAVAWGLNQHFAKDKPLTEPGDNGHDTLSGPGYAVYLGGIGSLGLITGVDALIRTWDTSSTKQVHVTSDEREVCDRRPLSKARLQVFSGERLVAEETTDADGKAALSCLYERLELLPARAEVRLNGQSPERQPLQESYGFARPSSAPESAQGAPKQSPAVAGPIAMGSSPTRRLLLFNAPLARGPRREVTDAVRFSGARSVDEAAHVSIFDVSSRAWPHAKLLKLLFDGRGLFVKAKWEGEYTGLHQTELLKALSERYGMPLRSEGEDGSITLSWPFEDGLEVRYTRVAHHPNSACEAGELSYVDPVHYREFEAAVNSAAP